MVEGYGVVQWQWQCHQVEERPELPYKEVGNIYLKIKMVEDLTDIQVISPFKFLLKKS